MKYKYLISGLILCCIVLSILYLNKPKIITVEEKIAKLDSSGFMINETAKPDTVIKDSIVYRDRWLKPDTVYKDNLIVKIEYDTVWLEDKKPYFESQKKFEAKYIGGLVKAYAPCPVDSFNILTFLNRKAFTKLYMTECEDPKKKWYYAGGGFILGMLATLTLN